MSLLSWFHRPWHEPPTIWIDTETTGARGGGHRAVQVALVRFERGVEVGSFVSLVNPGREIPAEATAIHGITDEVVTDQPDIDDLFTRPVVRDLLAGAQPGAYNAGFDRQFVPSWAFGEDWSWPWLDALSVVRVVDRFERGAGRHKLAAAAVRHGVELGKAHDALSDARAAGELFYRLVPKNWHKDPTLGELIRWQREQEAAEWFRFNEWLARQPPQEGAKQ